MLHSPYLGAHPILDWLVLKAETQVPAHPPVTDSQPRGSSSTHRGPREEELHRAMTPPLHIRAETLKLQSLEDWLEVCKR